MLKMELSTKHYNSSIRNYLFILLIVVILLECFPEGIVSGKRFMLPIGIAITVGSSITGLGVSPCTFLYR